ncbi:hypothetical protein [Nocardia sp. NPDC004860]|uniref:hypothetical protein n=1 Tax=Nocardia sp. NPDC004860 TaxID=3154557 RepID=UPI0033A8ED4B
MLTALFAAAATMTITAGPAAAEVQERVPFVDLSPNNKDARFIDENHWVIPIKAMKTLNGEQQPRTVGSCNGTMNANIVAKGGTGQTAVWFQASYQCTQPVSWKLSLAAYSYVSHPSSPAGSGFAFNHGLGWDPTVQGWSPLCKSNRNAGWSFRLTGSETVETANPIPTSIEKTAGPWTIGCRLAGVE